MKGQRTGLGQRETKREMSKVSTRTGLNWTQRVLWNEAELCEEMAKNTKNHMPHKPWNPLPTLLRTHKMLETDPSVSACIDAQTSKIIPAHGSTKSPVPKSPKVIIPLSEKDQTRLTNRVCSYAKALRNPGILGCSCGHCAPKLASCFWLSVQESERD